MSHIYDAIMGVIVGDALGLPVEFKERDTYTLTDMIGHGTYDQPAGTWSDDSSMTLATLESLVRLGRFNAGDVMNNFLAWLWDARFTPYDEVFDVGNATSRAITRFAKGHPTEECGGRELHDNGNGALMRIMPISLITPENTGIAASMTHAHVISTFACCIYTSIVQNLLRGMSPTEAVTTSVSSHTAEIAVPTLSVYSRLSHVQYLERDEIKSSGYVVDTLEAALWSFLTTRSYRECLLKAVNLGKDTDTVGAIAGGLAGLYYSVGGNKGIPESWIAKIARADQIASLCAAAELRFAV